MRAVLTALALTALLVRNETVGTLACIGVLALIGYCSRGAACRRRSLLRALN